MRQLVILAGGKGTRLRDRLGDLPKPLINVCGTPLLERQVLLAKRFRFEKVLILVNYRAEAIADFCEEKKNWGLDIECLDDGQPRGTAGALLQALDRLEDEFLVMYGDTMLEVDLDRFYQFHCKDKYAAATLFLHPNDHPHDSDLVDVDSEDRITGFFPYPHSEKCFLPNLVNAALYYVRRESMERWQQYAQMSDLRLDFGKDLFPKMIAEGQVLRGYNSPEYIKDCGTPLRIDKVSTDFNSGKIFRSTLEYPQAAVFVDRDGTLNHEIDHLISPEQFILHSGVEESIRRLNQAEYRVCVVTNQPVIARGDCTELDLRQIHNKMETLLGKHGAYLDRIFYCPHHPDKGFKGEVEAFKFNCNCRKPETGMVDKAIRELNIRREDSWMVGDASTDIMLGKRAALKTILVETGYAGKDYKHWAMPDFVVPDFAAAVNLILHIYPNLLKESAGLIQNVNPGEILFVGGQSRSGKSTYASVLCNALIKQGFTCHILSTDRWLLSEAERGDGLLKRHATSELCEIMESIIKPETRPKTLTLPGYRKHLRQHVAGVETITLLSSDIIIVEGVLALYLANLFNASYQFFIRLDESIRRERLVREYIQRGFSPIESEKIYNARLEEEVPLIENQTANAQTINALPY